MPRAIASTRARHDARAGKKPSTQAGEFIREEMHALHQGGGTVRSRQQAIAIGHGLVKPDTARSRGAKKAARTRGHV